MEERRKLKIIANAERNNPGIAAFGQSQVGKSYLMNCILQDKDGTFLVESPEKKHNFVTEINPIGGGQEATGVVTRFSSYNRNPEEYCKQYPIRFRALGIRDIMLIIADSFFNDFRDYETCSEAEILEMCDQWEEKYAHAPEVAHAPLCADDILEMKNYFLQYINAGKIFSVSTSFFDRMALLVDKIPVQDYSEVFPVIWDNNPEFTALFRKCIDILRRLHFAEYFYLPITAVTHHGVKADTIMSVACLKLLFSDEATNFMTDVYGGTAEQPQKLGHFTKSEICTICSEVIILIDKQYINSSGIYDMRDIRQENRQKVSSGNIEMKVLENSDLIDFPGARAREDGTILKLSESKEELMNGFLRGKVAYLFNKYNLEKNINILLYCHHHQNNAAPQMWSLLNNWVNEYVGDTPEKRHDLIRKTGVSPLFHVGTMWNLNLQKSDNSDIGDTENGIMDRWKGRFSEKLLNECLKPGFASWVENWTAQGKPFQNCYLLRDYAFSKNIYDGYECSGKEERMLVDKDYYETMRRTFCNNVFVKQLFSDPALSWDLSSSVGNDGALYIIQNLSVVAEKIYDAREEQLKQQFADILKACLRIMDGYYILDDTTEILKANIRKANGIFREMEFTCQLKPEYFGHLIQDLQLTEAQSFKEVHRLIPTLAEMVNGSEAIKDYELVRKRCLYFENCKNDEEKWQRLIQLYHFYDREEAEDFLKKKGIDPAKLFAGETIKRKNSSVISADLLSLWQDNIQNVKFMNKYSGHGLVDEASMSNLVECILNTAESVNLREQIEEHIADYTDVISTSSINEDLVADIIATTISDFIIDFGYKYLSGSQVEVSRNVAKEQHLPCFQQAEKERKEYYNEEEMTQLFSEILSSADRYTPAYDANYNSWLEYMYVAFIAHINVPNYDHEANDELKLVLDDFKK